MQSQKMYNSMNHDQTFNCENCEASGHIRFLRHRETMPGDYCPTCADIEKCAACSEITAKGFLTWQEDVRNYICQNCLADYKEVARYIKPLVQVEAKVVAMGDREMKIKKAS
jgi:RecJ-like exonuclease